MNALTQYLRTMVEPTVEEFVRNPLSPRHAYIACVVTYHAMDRVTYGKTKGEEQRIKQEWRKQCPMFALVEVMALDMKHVKSSSHGKPEVPVRKTTPIGFALLGTMGFNTHTLNDTGRNDAVRNLTFVVQETVKFLHKKAKDSI